MTWLPKVLNTLKHINLFFMLALIMVRVSFMENQLRILKRTSLAKELQIVLVFFFHSSKWKRAKETMFQYLSIHA